jgi:hypothetical protein
MKGLKGRFMIFFMLIPGYMCYRLLSYTMVEFGGERKR